MSSHVLPASMNYMAPEASTEGYTERSDVWSLGCVLFELVTTALLSRQQAVEKLQEVRANPDILDELFEDISKVMSLRLRHLDNITLVMSLSLHCHQSNVTTLMT